MRYELKFILDESRLVQAEHWLFTHTGCAVSHPDRTVNSLYFDDVDFSAMRDNLAGISRRRKSRLRWYGEIEAGICTSPLFEFKRRDGRLGWKEKIPLPGLETTLLERPVGRLYDHILEGYFTGSNFPIGELLLPALQVSYLRSYFEAPNGARVTFDRNIKFRAPDLHKTVPRLLDIPYPPVIMEIKFAVEQKNALGEMLRISSLVPKRHSKYAVGLAVLGLAQYI